MANYAATCQKYPVAIHKITPHMMNVIVDKGNNGGNYDGFPKEKKELLGAEKLKDIQKMLKIIMKEERSSFTNAIVKAKYTGPGLR